METIAMELQTHAEAREQQGLLAISRHWERKGTILPDSQRENGPADTLILDF